MDSFEKEIAVVLLGIFGTAALVCAIVWGFNVGT